VRLPFPRLGRFPLPSRVTAARRSAVSACRSASQSVLQPGWRWAWQGPRKIGVVAAGCALLLVLVVAVDMVAVPSAPTGTPSHRSSATAAGPFGATRHGPRGRPEDTTTTGAPPGAPLGPVNGAVARDLASPSGPGGLPHANGGGGISGGGAGAGSGTNLLGGNQVDFNGTTGTWIAMAGSLRWVPAPATTPGGSLEAIASSNQSMWAWSGSPQSGGLARATPGSVYSAAAVVQSAGAPVLVQPVVGFFDAAGNYLTSVWGSGATAVAGSWTWLSPALGIAPPGSAYVGMAVLIYSGVVGPALYLELPALTGTPGHAGTHVVGPLHVAGNRVVQANGVPVVLRGTELYGLDAASASPSVSAAAVASASAWGANMMRVALGEQLWDPSSCRYDPNYQSAVDQAVQWITSLGMVAVLELQDSSLGGGCPAGSPHDMADNPGSVEFWSQVASRYAGNPLVAFDLYNEPHDISDQVWLNGGQVSEGGTTYIAAGMQQLYDVVHAVAPQNVVFVSGNNWGNTVPSSLVFGTNIVYSVHAYTCPGAAPPACGTANPMDPSPILGQWTGVGATYPVVVGEFGWPNNADGTYMRNVVAYANAHGWGWNAFAFTSTAPWGLVSSTPASGPFQPSPSGMPVLAALAGLS